MSNSINIILQAEQLEGTQAIVSNWLVQPGDKVIKDSPIVELETDKVAIEVTASQTGVLLTIDAQLGKQVIAGDLLATIKATSEANITTNTIPTSQVALENKTPSSTTICQKTASIDKKSKRHLLGPAVKKLISEHQLNSNHINATGLDGRISKRDVQLHIENFNSKNNTTTWASSTAESTYNQSNTDTKLKENTGRQSTFIPHTPMRSAIANHMVQSLLNTSPHVTSVFEMDMSAIIEHRAQRKIGYKDAQVNLTFTAYFLAASAIAIKDVPQINSQFHSDGLEIFDNINIGVGTALADSGLVVPVVKNVQEKCLFELATNLTEQTNKARDQKLTASDMSEGTFTISNYGVSGSLLATPIIINQPQVAILGVGKMEKRVLVKTLNGQDTMVIKPMCYVSLSIDHRALDAYQTNKFLTKFVEVIENWES
jgi:2-oxoglutarate dehydrogenase E2 component (dihydrolipoamide succinyltransferase)